MLSDRVVAAEIVVLAVPREAIPSVVARLGDVSGRVVVDATNPLKADPWADDEEA
ncbi:MAG TPA: NAD(P)-binding domain-containing protein [Solirubrobacteraceae bacterium]|nr:NAD(P)-binding domain-containing protein [Solirubrobacteraceae bacterium]